MSDGYTKGVQGATKSVHIIMRVVPSEGYTKSVQGATKSVQKLVQSATMLGLYKVNGWLYKKCTKLYKSVQGATTKVYKSLYEVLLQCE